jgi:hypothetical protein
MKKILVALSLLISLGTHAQDNRVGLVISPGTWGYGVRIDHDFLYESYVHSDIVFPSGYIHEHNKLTLGGIIDTRTDFGDITFGVSYNTYGRVFSYIPLNKYVTSMFSFEIGTRDMLTSKVGYSFSLDIWQRQVNIGINFKL